MGLCLGLRRCLPTAGQKCVGWVCPWLPCWSEVHKADRLCGTPVRTLWEDCGTWCLLFYWMTQNVDWCGKRLVGYLRLSLVTQEFFVVVSLRRISFGLSRNPRHAIFPCSLGRKDYMTSEKDVCVEGYVSGSLCSALARISVCNSL